MIGGQQIAAGRIVNLRHLIKANLFVPNQIAAVAGEIFLPIPTGGALGYAAIMQKVNIATAVGINKVERDNSLHGHCFFELIEIARLIHRHPLRGLAYLAHTGIAHRISAVACFKGRAMRRRQQTAWYRQIEITEQLNFQPMAPAFKAVRLAVEHIFIIIIGVQRQLINIDEVGFVNRHAIANIGIETFGDKRHAWKNPAMHIPALIRFYMRLIPSDRPG